jgi:hypothetical protein
MLRLMLVRTLSGVRKEKVSTHVYCLIAVERCSVNGVILITFRISPLFNSNMVYFLG